MRKGVDPSVKEADASFERGWGQLERGYMDKIADSIGRLRQDALDRGMLDLSIAYGWSQIRLNEEKIGRQMTKLELYKMAAKDIRQTIR